MGKSVAVRFSLTITLASRRYCTPSTWNVRSSTNIPGNGKPTTANIDKWVAAFEASMHTHNKHLGIDQVTYAHIVDHKSGQVVAQWRRSEQRHNQPMFECLTPIPSQFCSPTSA